MRNRIFELSNSKTLLPLLIFALCFGMTLTSYGQAVVSLQPTTLAAPEVGEQLTVNVDITGGKAVAGYQISVAFDPAMLSYVSATDAGYFPSGAYAVPLQSDQDITLVAAALEGTATETTGTLAVLTFEVLQPNPFSSLQLTDVILANADATAQTVQWADVQGNWNEPINAAPPEETVMLPNYPNPFNPETWIPYRLAAPAEVTLTIHSTDGKLVRTLALGHQATGVYQSKSRAAYWDGRNALGEHVASGLYFYTFTAGDFTATGKMLILK